LSPKAKATLHLAGIVLAVAGGAAFFILSPVWLFMGVLCGTPFLIGLYAMWRGLVCIYEAEEAKKRS
jgi:ABC-type arginine/histidine transport system permease subunit